MSNPIGQLDVLNCGKGHLQIKFDRNDPADSEKAKRVITDMLRRGYALFVEIDGQPHRVKDFDPEREEYILKDPAEITGDEPTHTPPTEPEAHREGESESANPNPETPTAQEAPAGEAGGKPVRGPGRPRGRRAGMRTHKATGIAPTAGG